MDAGIWVSYLEDRIGFLIPQKTVKIGFIKKMTSRVVEQ